ncbi:MAG: hypothetical protein KBD52_01445 [Candidatus Pacebacteria bacterium]|nr:hypothetical protein [Candidatus Paceibacterota bacterium]
MKIKFPKIKKVFKKQDFTIYPGFYWKILLAASFVLISISFLFSLLVFLKINKETIVSPEELDLQTQTVKHERIDNVLKYFKEREKKTNEILNSPAIVIDPSL